MESILSSSASLLSGSTTCKLSVRIFVFNERSHFCLPSSHQIKCSLLRFHVSPSWCFAALEFRTRASIVLAAPRRVEQFQQQRFNCIVSFRGLAESHRGLAESHQDQFLEEQMVCEGCYRSSASCSNGQLRHCGTLGQIQEWQQQRKKHDESVLERLQFPCAVLRYGSNERSA